MELATPTSRRREWVALLADRAPRRCPHARESMDPRNVVAPGCRTGRGTVHPGQDTDLFKGADRLVRRAPVSRLGRLLRNLWPALNEQTMGRKLSVEHEEAWLTLAGFLLRPGFGFAHDGLRMDELWQLRDAGLCFPGKRGKVQEYILWRRVAGGLTAERKTRINSSVSTRTWRVGMGVPGTALQSLMLDVLKATDALDTSKQLVNLDYAASIDALISAIVPAMENAERTIAAPGIRLMSVAQAEAIAKCRRERTDSKDERGGGNRSCDRNCGCRARHPAGGPAPIAIAAWWRSLPLSRRTMFA